MNPAPYRMGRTDSKDWVQPRSSTSQGLAIQQKEKLVLTETFKRVLTSAQFSLSGVEPIGASIAGETSR
jgi:hypothetical protein